MRRVELLAVLAALTLAVAPLAGCGRDGGAEKGKAASRVEPDDSALPAPPNVALPAGVTAAMVAEGRKQFGTACVVCHGPDAAGTQLAPSLRDGEWLNTSGEFGEIERLIHEGVPEPKEYPVPMPPNGGGLFTREQVRSMAAYVFALSRGRTQPAPADSAAR